MTTTDRGGDMAGPLAGVRVLELAGIGPAPFAATVLSDLGAEVLRLDRPDTATTDAGTDTTTAAGPPPEPLGRGRRSVAVDLKHPDAVALVLDLVGTADVLLEGFRPGVCERLGLGPDACLDRNPRLVYARVTGWGQEGPLARAAGHDLTYLAVSGALWPIGPADGPPTPPVNYVGDFGGGGMLAATGVLAALVERATSGRGQVVDAAMLDGATLQTAMLHGHRADGSWHDERGVNLFDGGAPFYRCYACSDGRYVAVGALEPQFYAALLDGLGQDPGSLPDQDERDWWPELAQHFAAVFATRTRDEWAETFAGTDACVAPVLSPAEAPGHPHNRERGTFTDVAGVVQPAPAPRLSRTPAAVAGPPPRAGEHTAVALGDWGVPDDTVTRLRASGAIG